MVILVERTPFNKKYQPILRRELIENFNTYVTKNYLHATRIESIDDKILDFYLENILIIKKESLREMNINFRKLFIKTIRNSF